MECKSSTIGYSAILIVLLVFLSVQIYERFQPDIMIGGNLATGGEYYYVDLSEQPLHCDWNNKTQNVENCIDVSEDKVCKYNLDGTFAGECWDKSTGDKLLENS